MFNLIDSRLTIYHLRFSRLAKGAAAAQAGKGAAGFGGVVDVVVSGRAGWLGERVGRGRAASFAGASPLHAPRALGLLAHLSEPAELFVCEDAADAQLDLRAHACGGGLGFGQLAGALADERVIGLTRVNGLIESAPRLVDATKECARLRLALPPNPSNPADLFGRQVQTPQEADGVAATPTPCLSLFLPSREIVVALGERLPGGGEENQHAEREPERRAHAVE